MDPKCPVEGTCNVFVIFSFSATWKTLHQQLVADGHTLVPIEQNLIDAIWENKPKRPHNPVFVHPLRFSGEFGRALLVSGAA